MRQYFSSDSDDQMPKVPGPQPFHVKTLSELRKDTLDAPSEAIEFLAGFKRQREITISSQRAVKTTVLIFQKILTGGSRIKGLVANRPTVGIFCGQLRDKAQVVTVGRGDLKT